MKTYKENLMELRLAYDQVTVCVNDIYKVDKELSNKLMESLNIIRSVIVNYQHRNGR